MAIGGGFALFALNLPRYSPSGDPIKDLQRTKDDLLDCFHGEYSLFDEGFEGFDVVLECTGAEVCMQQAVYVST
jgi:threonine dehydrogenase-like Zn-dependent dehydrogenase